MVSPTGPVPFPQSEVRARERGGEETAVCYPYPCRTQSVPRYAGTGRSEDQEGTLTLGESGR